MATGEGYGADLLAARAASVVGVEANPDAFEHARLRYRRPNLRFERSMVEVYAEPCDAVVFLQTIEHVQDPGRGARALQGDARAGRPRVRLDAERADARAARRGALGQPVARARVPPGRVRARCARRTSPTSSCYGLFHARKLALHQVAIDRLGWDAIHRAARVTQRFYDRFVPAISARDFALRAGRDLDRALDLVAVLRP